ncbi:MAG TPA: calcium/sodium antiporter [Thermoplasmatales archaeon]|nr:calcium/sodium antiporter [Thermoplasmatales archaeon]
MSLTLNLIIESVFFLVSVLLLYKGSDILVIGTSKTAARLGVSSLVISLTVVAYGTSVPELAASGLAAFQSHPGFSLGNIAGSCLANLLLVLGLSAVINPLSVSKTIIKREMPVLLLSVTLLLFLAYLNMLNLVGGLVLVVFFILYLVFFLRVAHTEHKNSESLDEKNVSLKKYGLFIMLGIIFVVAGAQLLVDSAVFFAKVFGVPEIVIAISLVAIGTSLPELAVSAVASKKGQSDISIGNLIGSNVFNILLIIGVCSIITPLPADSRFLLSTILLLLVTIVLFPILYTGKRISRWEGVFLVSIYFVYMWFIFFYR